MSELEKGMSENIFIGVDNGLLDTLHKDRGEKMIKAMIFDLDGTIGNTVPLCIKAFKKSIEPLIGRSVSEKEIIATFGPTEEGTIMSLIPEAFEKGVERYLYHYKALHTECPKPFEGISEIIRALKRKGIRIAMVTGKGSKSTAMTLEQFEIADLFEWVETGSIEGNRKCEGITCVIKHFNIKPTEAYYIGDAPSDILSARQAGVGMLSAAWSDMIEVEELGALKPDKLFRTIEEFEAFCKII